MATMTSDTSATDVGADDDTPTAVQRLRDQADAVVNRIQPQIAAVSSYARDEPTRALLISAATGAALMGLVALIVRSSGSRSVVPDRGRAAALGSSAMAAIREAALDLAGRAQSMAADALDMAQQRAADAFDTAQQRAAQLLDAAKGRAGEGYDAAKSKAGDHYDDARKRGGDALDAQHKRAADALDDVRKRASAAAADPIGTASDAWKAVRQQAQPMVDKVRPQIDAMASYAKEDPVKTAIGAAAAAAVVIGLVALARRAGDD